MFALSKFPPHSLSHVRGQSSSAFSVQRSISAIGVRLRVLLLQSASVPAMPLGTADNFAGTADTPDAAAGSLEVAAHSLGAAARIKPPVLVRARSHSAPAVLLLAVLLLAVLPFAPMIFLRGLLFPAMDLPALFRR